MKGEARGMGRILILRVVEMLCVSSNGIEEVIVGLILLPDVMLDEWVFCGSNLVKMLCA